jgi:hypothetical protein
MVVINGVVKNGVVVLEQGSRPLPDGTRVKVEFVPAPLEKPAVPSGEEKLLGDEIMKFAGCMKGLPSDFARNHDHYIHGTRKK